MAEDLASAARGITVAQLDEVLSAIWNREGPFAPPPPHQPIPPEHQGDLIHFCGCREFALNVRLPGNALCFSCGLMIRYLGPRDEVTKGLRPLVEEWLEV